MADINITRSGELMVAEVRADDEPGTTWLDAWYPTRGGAEYQVVDSGRLVIATADIPGLIEGAHAAGLTTELHVAAY